MEPALVLLVGAAPGRRSDERHQRRADLSSRSRP